MSDPIKCDKAGCSEDAKHSGYVYGREKGSTKIEFFLVNACETHAESSGFFKSGKVEKVSEHIEQGSS